MPRDTRKHEHSDDADLRRWFAALGPPPTGRASPLLRASVLAQIEQRRTRHGIWEVDAAVVVGRGGAGPGRRAVFLWR